MVCERERSPGPSWFVLLGKKFVLAKLTVGSERARRGRVENAFHSFIM